MNSDVNTPLLDFVLIIGPDLLNNLLYAQLCDFAFESIVVIQKTSFQSAIEYLDTGQKVNGLPKLVLVDLDGLDAEYDAMRRWHLIVRQTYGEITGIVYLSYGKINYLLPDSSICILKPITVKALRLSVLMKLPIC